MGPLYDVTILFSDIDGLGMFSTVAYDNGKMICPARVGKYRTEAGRYINHSDDPNVKMVQDDNSIWVYACKEIKNYEELLVNYEENLKLNE